ncbi:MAG: flagellar export protein FliJ [Bdellovibrionota bacterium]
MKFKFSLQKVLEHRKTLENIAQRDFQEALVAHRKELAVLESMKNQRQQGFQDRFKIQTKAGKDLPPQLQQVHEYLTGQDKRIEIQKAKVQEVENLVEKMREILRQKAISFKIIEKLKEKKFRDFMTERNSAEQKEIDEINVIRHSREDLK